MRNSPSSALDGDPSSEFAPDHRPQSRSLDLGSDKAGTTNRNILRDLESQKKANEKTALLPKGKAPAPPLVPLPENTLTTSSSFDSNSDDSKKGGFVIYVIYAAINIIMCVPCLYGYASVIFNNDAYQPYINTLSKLVLFSSVVHQCCFSYFSSLNFSIGQVQDAGLIFLSAMANTIADGIIQDGGTPEEIVSTAIVVLGIATASLGAVLILMGKNRLADAVAYLPLPVVGGYLAFIGYFCFEAGVALCISDSIVELPDWVKMFNLKAVILALPGLVAGAFMTWTSRNAKSDAALPIVMVAIPALFYALIFALGYGMEGAREGGWVGDEAPPIPPMDVFKLIEFEKVRWEYIEKCIPTWAGMVFVVSFSSCLDVAAISMDMGEALDTNNELVTVGISNLISGLTCGFTGSYIFSQTIFVYRTGCNSRWIGIFTAIGEISVFICTVNVLEVTPLFFLGSTLIFIGFDLMYEWLIEVRHKLLLTEYCVLLVTFIAIQLVGIDAGIILGIVIAIVDYVITTARVSTLTRVFKRSRAVWKPEEWKLLQEHGYRIQDPKIVTLELKGSVFFGSSLQLFNSITAELNVSTTSSDRMEMISSMASPRHMSRAQSLEGLRHKHQKGRLPRVNSRSSLAKGGTQPEYVVLDLSQMSNLDASAARGCFLQLAKMCEKRGIMVFASGANSRVDWMLRSHDCAYTRDEEEEVKVRLQEAVSPYGAGTAKLLLFRTLYEALEFCEHKLISKLDAGHSLRAFTGSLPPRKPTEGVASGKSDDSKKQTLSSVFGRYLGKKYRNEAVLKGFEGRGEEKCYEEVTFNSGDTIFSIGDPAVAFYVVLSGSVAGFLDDQDVMQQPSDILSGAGKLQAGGNRKSFAGTLGDVRKFYKTGSIFGFVDFELDQCMTFTTVAARDGTVVAKVNRDALDALKARNPELEKVLDKVLLQASILELANAVDP